MNRFHRAVALAATITAAPVAVLAHHGWSDYDANKPLKITAPLTDVTWSNPHGAAKVRYQNKTWAVVLAPIARMEQRGLSRDALRSSAQVTLEGFPRKDGVAEIKVERVTVNGKTTELR